MEEAPKDKAFSIADVHTRIEELKRFVGLMEPVVVPQSFLSIPGIKLLKLGLTKEELRSKLVWVANLLKEIENPPTRLAVKTAIGYFDNLYKPSFTDEQFEIIQRAKDNQVKYTGDGFEEGAEALAFWELYKVELPGVLMDELSRADPKVPRGFNWSKKSYLPDSDEIKRWCAACGNVGVNVGYGGIVVLDEDIFNSFDETGIWKIISKSNRQVKTGKGNHYYYEVGSEEVAKKLVNTMKKQGGLYNKKGEHIGDFKLYQSNVVAPGSLHPSGRRYEVVNDGPIEKISEEQILAAIEHLKKPKGGSVTPEKCSTAYQAYDSSKPFVQAEWMADIPIMELLLKLFPEWKITKNAGGFDEGIHPLHGSDSGCNLGINTETNSFRCYRDNVSGGPVELFAILSGLMPCESLTGWKRGHPEKYNASLTGLRELGYDVPLDDRPMICYAKADVFTLKTELILKAVKELYLQDTYSPPLLMSNGALHRVQRMTTRRGGEMVEVALPQKLNAGALRGLLNRALNVIIETRNKKGEPVYRESGIEDEVITDLLNLDQPEGVPLLSGMTEHPLFNADGSVLDKPGFDKVSGIFYMPPPGFRLAERPTHPTREDAKAAAQYIFDEVLEGFRWEHEDGSDAVNALAFLLRPLIRPMIAGPMPLCLINKRQPQTGGSKLSQIPSLILTGHPAIQFSPIADEEEFRKKITTTLKLLPPEVIIDNADKGFPVQTFCSLLTANVWSDRILGGNDMFTHEHRTCWTANGNNLTAKLELVLRGFLIGLDAATAHPETRTDFKHPHNELEVWIKDNRHIILAKLITIVEGWIAAGRPAATKKWGNSSGFNEAMAMMAALCDFALPEDMPGFNSNAAENARSLEDGIASAYANFIRFWGQKFGDRYVSIGEFADERIFEFFDAGEIPDELIFENNYGQRSFLGRQKLAEKFKAISKKRFEEDDLYIVAVRNAHTKQYSYYMPQGAAYYLPESTKELEEKPKVAAPFNPLACEVIL